MVEKGVKSTVKQAYGRVERGIPQGLRNPALFIVAMSIEISATMGGAGRSHCRSRASVSLYWLAGQTVQSFEKIVGNRGLPTSLNLESSKCLRMYKIKEREMMERTSMTRDITDRAYKMDGCRNNCA